MGTFSDKLVALILLLSPLIVQAAKPDPTIGGPWPDNATLTVSHNHELEWLLPYTEFVPQGYDVYYDASPQDPGYNPSRIETGARSPWTDNLTGFESRCVAGNYWIRAYDKGRKTYSPELRATPGYLCGSTPPVADAGPDQTVGRGDIITLDGGGSYDIDGSIESYVWTHPDVTIIDGETSAVSFQDEGSYTITLTVTDDADDQDTDTLDVTVSDTPPPPPDDLFSDAQGDTPSCLQTKLVREVELPHYPAGYTELVFSDEFDAPLDATVWNSRYEWNNIINNEAQYYVDALGADSGVQNWSPFTIADGKLTITANTTTDAGLEWLSSQPFVSGVLNTQHKVSFNGSAGDGLFFEAYARPARGNGMWSAFWLYHKEYANPDPEIDIFEYLGQSLADNGNWLQATNKDGMPSTEANYNTWDTQYHTYFPGAGGPKGKSIHGYTNQKLADAPEWCGEQGSNGIDGVDFSYAFHKYSVEWTSEHIKWYIDDILLHQVTSSERKIANEDMYIILNLAIGSDASQDVSWPGAPDLYTESLIEDGNAKMVVDWIRVYGK